MNNFRLKVYNIWGGVYVGEGQYEGGSFEDFEIKVSTPKDYIDIEELIENELIDQYQNDTDEIIDSIEDMGFDIFECEYKVYKDRKLIEHNHMFLQ